MASVYIETTIPSYYYESRREKKVQFWRETTREWWNSTRQDYVLCTSRFVLIELENAPAKKSRDMLELMKEVDVLTDPPGLQDVVEYYIEHKLMPAGESGDAYHLAMASMHKIDFLLTWNCRHLANARKFQHLQILNRRLDLSVLIVTTPLMLMSED